MKYATIAALAVVSAQTASAGGIDRSGQGIGTLFEKGEVAEFSFGYVSPTVEGALNLAPANVSGDMGSSYSMWSLGYKRPLNDKIDLAVILDQPWGASIAYPTTTTYPLRGTTAVLSSYAVSAFGRYHFNESVSVHGGLRLQTMSGDVAIPAGGYTLSATSDLGVGYSIGAAYEIPRIALRAALTYNSEISHSIDSLENGVLATNFELVTPQSINFDFQTGIAENTLLMASVRWVEWSKFDITPVGYAAANGGDSLVSYADDRIAYTLGVGRKFSDTWSGSVTLGYEPATGGLSSNLSPTDGYKSIAIGAQYTKGNMKISGGVRYLQIGDAVTEISPPLGGVFHDNTGFAVGFKVSYSF